MVEYVQGVTNKSVVFTNREIQVAGLRNTTQIGNYSAIENWLAWPHQLEEAISRSGLMKGEKLHAHLMNQFSKVVRQGFLGFKAAGKLSRQCGSFMFTRWDAILDKHLRLKLLEINNSPSLFGTTVLNTTVPKGQTKAHNMMSEAMDIVVELAADPTSRQFITRTPLLGTAADFWRWNLAYDEAQDVC
eukprot:TRINITY_DN54973_c0_g1_i2.p1 TRINITY_DN54973_c0_g1~~TRINITY_DN54973_c0_g1_i2.p1  ORF type:complete len:211 (-),score=18.51 TRINITY_DN54973_c0_g1_i2:113-676(-)